MINITITDEEIFDFVKWRLNRAEARISKLSVILDKQCKRTHLLEDKLRELGQEPPPDVE